MKAVILYKPGAETDSQMQEYLREFTHRTGKTIEQIDVTSPRGVELAELYDVQKFPALVAIEDNGTLVDAWPELEKWPTMNELTYYTQ
jgi:hypothetical protein